MAVARAEGLGENSLIKLLWGQGRINHMAEAAYAAGPTLLAIFGGPAHSRKNEQTAKWQKIIYFVIWNLRL